jgi:hypothetical protein
MRYIKIIFSTIAILLIVLAFWVFDPLHTDVEKMDNLIGQNYAYAVETIGERPISNLNESYGKFNVKIPANVKLKDSSLKCFVWDFSHYNIIIWTAKTEKYNDEIIKAIRYKDFVEF